MSGFEAQDIDTIMAVDGMLWRDEAIALYRAAREAKVGIVEIGSYTGMSSIALALGSKRGNRVPVYCIDPHEHFVTPLFTFDDTVRGQFMQNVVNAGVADIVRLINLRSGAAVHALDNVAFDLLFIDGDHSESSVYRDLCLFAPSLTNGGRAFCHDVNLATVARAIERFLEPVLTFWRAPDVHFLGCLVKGDAP